MVDWRHHYDKASVLTASVHAYTDQFRQWLAGDQAAEPVAMVK